MKNSTQGTVTKNLQSMMEEQAGQTLRKYVVSDLLEHDTDKEIREYAYQVLEYGCVSGAVSGLIYYHDTYQFFDHFYSEIMDLLHTYEEKTGLQIPYKGDLKNTYAWFAYETELQSIIDELSL